MLVGMTTTRIDTRAVSALQDSIAGEVLMAGDGDAYEQARVLFNAAVDLRPAVTVQCEGVDDVARAIGFARTHDLEIAVRGGGHGVAGTALSDGGLVVDLRRMNAVTVDPVARTATVCGGAVMRDLDRATSPFGLAVTGGRVSTTGVGGLALGGGSGWLDRSMGLLCDNLLGAELVTADGTILHARPDEHPDLFWALHGGGGNFGIVTSFTFKLHPLERVTVAILVNDPAAALSITAAFTELMRSAPRMVGGALQWHTAPDKAFVPAHLAGQLACTVVFVVAAGQAQAREQLAPLLDHPQVGGRLLLELPYAQLQCMLDDPPGYRNWWSTEYLADLPDAAVDAFTTHGQQVLRPSPSALVLVPLGGAVADAATGDPISWRQASWQVLAFGMWADPADDHRGRGWAHGMREVMRPWATGEVYLNFIGDEGHDRIVAGFAAGTFERLVEVKRRYDPDNAFHRNHNINPDPELRCPERAPKLDHSGRLSRTYGSDDSRLLPNPGRHDRRDDGRPDSRHGRRHLTASSAPLRPRADAQRPCVDCVHCGAGR
jgi:FAD/FMN-containing dehydrogenase